MTLITRPGYLWNETIWNPSMILTALWFDAEDSSTIASSSNLVGQWNDKSGNARHATATSVYRPTYSATGLNSRPSLVSARTGPTRMTLPTFTIGNQFHLFAVLNAANSGDYQYIFGNGSGGIGVLARTSAALEDWQIGDALSFGRDFVQANNPRSIGPITWSGPSVFYSALGATTSTTELNATRISTRVEATNATAMTNTLPALFSPASNSITQSLEGSMSEFIMILGSLSLTNKQKLEGYLAHKWGLEANLPSDHPYKTTGPTP